MVYPSNIIEKEANDNLIQSHHNSLLFELPVREIFAVSIPILQHGWHYRRYYTCRNARSYSWVKNIYRSGLQGPSFHPIAKWAKWLKWADILNDAKNECHCGLLYMESWRRTCLRSLMLKLLMVSRHSMALVARATNARALQLLRELPEREFVVAGRQWWRMDGWR